MVVSSNLMCYIKTQSFMDHVNKTKLTVTASEDEKRVFKSFRMRHKYLVKHFAIGVKPANNIK